MLFALQELLGAQVTSSWSISEELQLVASCWQLLEYVEVISL